jgi:sugar/nucleoside kinase (ribokinase family)
MVDVLGIGNAIVDILCRVDDHFLAQHDLSKSTMHLTETSKQNFILKGLINPIKESGGSAANTIATLSQLGLKSAFIGQTADDIWGRFFAQDMLDIGVETRLNILDNNIDYASGTSVILITPDGERTMNTNLGVASHINMNCLDTELINNSKILYIEGYLYDTPEARKAIDIAVDAAHSNCTQVALTLSDSFCVDRHRKDFKKLIEHVDILFANESEFCSLFEISNQKLSIETIQNFKHELPSTVAITQSERGASIIYDYKVINVLTTPIDVPKDLTGAGDQFAAGFLYGVIKNWSVEKCAEYGIDLATRIITKIGPRFAKNELN